MRDSWNGASNHSKYERNKRCLKMRDSWNVTD